MSVRLFFAAWVAGLAGAITPQQSGIPPDFRGRTPTEGPADDRQTIRVAILAASSGSLLRPLQAR